MAKLFAVVIAALILTVLGLYACLRVTRAGMDALGLDVAETLIWFGLAEIPEPATPRAVRARTAQRPSVPARRPGHPDRVGA